MKRLLVLVVLAAATAPVLAQPAPAPVDTDERAKAASHYKQGLLYFKAGDYDRAIVEYQDAYALSQEPLLLFNIALCNDRANRPEKALEGFQKYLDLAPDGEVADEAREDVARLTPVVEEIRTKRKAEQDAEAAKKAEEQRKQDEARKQADAEAAKQREAERQRRIAAAAPLENRSKLERWAGLGAAGLGVVSVALGVKFGLDAKADADAVSAHTMDPWTDELIARDAHGRSAETKMIVFSSIGGAFILGGGVLYMLGAHTHQKAEEMRLSFAPTRGGAAFGLSGTW